MKRSFWMFGLLLFCAIVSLGQDNPVDKKNEVDQIVLKKQLVVNDLENQIKSVPIAAVRVCTRYRMAAWLWKGGTDKTGRAEDVAASALDDYYKNKDEILPIHSCMPQLFVLLDANAKDLAKRLRNKYKISSDETQLIPALLGQKNGDKLAVDAAVRLLTRQNENSPDLVYLLMRLNEQQSPELNRLLSAIMVAEQSGRTRFPTNMIEIFSDYFISPNVPLDVRRWFLGRVVAGARNVAVLTDIDQWAYYRMLQKLLPEISATHPEIINEAGTAHSLLSAKVGRSIREANERYERIKNSADKLAATVSEAERTDDKTAKYSLYRSAARLALNEKKFVYAVDLMGKATEIELPPNSTPEDMRAQIHNEFYRDVVAKALKAKDPESAAYAIKRMSTPLFIAGGFGEIFKYRVDNGESDAGRLALDEAIKFISKTESSPDGIALVLSMIPSVQKMDPARVFEISEMAAKSINSIPTLNVEDKPETKNYKDYVTKVMAINRDLRPALTDLIKENRNAATNLANRIDKKEIQIMANLVLLTDPVSFEPTVKKEKESAQVEN
jgi:hypothetical protein